MPGSPIIPGRPANPVGQVQRIRKAARAWDRYLDQVRKWLFETIDRMQVRVVNDARYDYQIDLGQLREVVREILIRLGYGPNDSLIEQVMAAYEEGTGLSVINLSKITDSYTRSITQVLSSHSYLRRSALIKARVMEEMKSFTTETGQDLARVLSEAVENGLNPRDLKDRLANRFGISKGRAERIARTEITGALRRARLDEAQDARETLGINTGMLWISALSPTTRATHAARHAHIYNAQEVREFYARDSNGINCYLPGTQVTGRFVAGSKAHYSGEVIKLVTRGGRNLTVTPNHPVMTDQGLVPAAEIKEGDHLVCHRVQVENPVGVPTLDDQQVVSSIEQVFAALSELGHVRPRRVTGIDFHGDARFMDEDVDVVDVDRPLVLGNDAALFQALDDVGLKHSDSVVATGSCSPSFHFGAINLATPGLLCSLRQSLPVLSRRLFRAVECSLAAITPFLSVLSKPLRQSLSGNAGFFADLQNRLPRGVLPAKIVNVVGKPLLADLVQADALSFQPNVNGAVAASAKLTDRLQRHSGLVLFDDVIRVEFIHYSGHVYDLQEVSGLMVANGVMASNCKCGQTEILLNEDGSPETPGVVERLTRRKATVSN